MFTRMTDYIPPIPIIFGIKPIDVRYRDIVYIEQKQYVGPLGAWPARGQSVGGQCSAITPIRAQILNRDAIVIIMFFYWYLLKLCQRQQRIDPIIKSIRTKIMSYFGRLASLSGMWSKLSNNAMMGICVVFLLNITLIAAYGFLMRVKSCW